MRAQYIGNVLLVGADIGAAAGLHMQSALEGVCDALQRCRSTGRHAQAKHFQRHKLPWPAPSAATLSDLASLEHTMRSTLTSLASFNETERMVLLKQCTFQERAARKQAHAQGRCVHAPPGLLSLDQFIACWHNLSVLVSVQQAKALFFKYGCDSEGLLPYEVFAMRLLSGQARIVALEPDMAGPWPTGTLARYPAYHDRTGL